MNDWVNSELFLALTGILLVMIYGYASKKADITGVLAGGTIATLLYMAIKWEGMVYFFTFFIVGSLASKWKYRQKEQLRVAQENKGKRSAVHAFSNAGPAAMFSLLAFVGHPEPAEAAVAAVFTAALSDTLASEIGNVLGKRYFNILTLKKDKKGLDGVISWEGTSAGIAGSLLIAVLYHLFNGSMAISILIFLAGLVSNLLDSLLGASLQRRGYLNNHLVNFITTLFSGASVLFVMYLL